MRQQAESQRVLIITVFGGIPLTDIRLSSFAQEIHQKMTLPLTPKLVIKERRAEDLEAATRLNAAVLWLEQLDAIYRGQPAFYSSGEALFGDIHPVDFDLGDHLNGVFAVIQQQTPLATFYLPLGVGHHVDHQLCSLVGAKLVQRGANVRFYEDFPYVIKSGALEKRLQELGGNLVPEFAEVSRFLSDKIEAAACYKSQVPLFSDLSTMRQAFETYHHSVQSEARTPHERTWVLKRMYT